LLATESRWAKQMAWCPYLPSMAISRSGAMNAARSISINHPRCEDTIKNFLILSLPILFFGRVGTVDAAGVRSRACA
jgi:hypothetical protein